MAVISNNILITFDMIVDIDIGLFDVIKESYNDPNVFREEIFELDSNIIKGLLRESDSGNPLSILLIDSDSKQADAYYDEFMEYEYDNIVKNAPTTTMVDVLDTFIDSGGAVVPNIICKTKSEYQRVEEIFKDSLPNLFSIIFSEDYSTLDVSLYDTFFLKYIDTLTKFNIDMVMGKNLIISDYKCNLDDKEYELKRKVPKAEYLVMYATNNEFRTVTLYYYDESYYNDIEEEEGE